MEEDSFFIKVAASAKTQKGCPDLSKGVPFCRPKLLLIYFQGLALEVLQIEKKAPVFNHSIAEHRP